MPQLMIDNIPIAHISADVAKLLIGLGYESPGDLVETPIVERRDQTVKVERPIGGAKLRTYKWVTAVNLTLGFPQTEDRIERD